MDYRMRRTHCKHILMILIKVFHLSPSAKAFRYLTLSHEDLQKMYTTCTPDPSVLADEQLQKLINTKMYGPETPVPNENIERRPLDTSDCPICFEEFEEAEISKILFCKICRNNVHQTCFDSWVATRGSNVTCVYCRSEWVDDRMPTKKKGKARLPRGPEGYVNFSSEAGMSLKRDTSTYGR
ncbi:hypothetical protein DFQ30_004732 [Apophysomyces sp. BC1015]|nr:hypothetical protein DFQ30_004732 [Apophysomyces sp. BC1015]